MSDRTPKLEVETALQELTQAVQKMDQTLSEVMVLLYHVVQAHQEVLETVRDERGVPAVSAELAAAPEKKKKNGRRPMAV
jgi:hypothetical protein